MKKKTEKEEQGVEAKNKRGKRSVGPFMIQLGNHHFMVT